MARFQVGSVGWLERLHEVVGDCVREAPKEQLLETFVLSELYTDAPTGIANQGDDFGLTIRIADGVVNVTAGSDSRADLTVVADYQAFLAIACYVVADHDDGAIELEHMVEAAVADKKLMMVGEAPAYLAPVHDRIASRSRPIA
ncbi:MAG: hypothetical protein O7A71_01635 [Chloroflexi bacterium]|nr:hypothetical protein [Chloroflexota bacterium]